MQNTNLSHPLFHCSVPFCSPWWGKSPHFIVHCLSLIFVVFAPPLAQQHQKMGQKRKSIAVFMTRKILNYFFMWFILKQSYSNSLFTFPVFVCVGAHRRVPACQNATAAVIVLNGSDRSAQHHQMFAMCLTICLILFYVYSITAHGTPEW